MTDNGDSLTETQEAAPEAEEPVQCAICLQDITERKSYLYCGHVFHYNCIRQYFNVCNVRRCPICRNVADGGTGRDTAWDGSGELNRRGRRSEVAQVTNSGDSNGNNIPYLTQLQDYELDNLFGGFQMADDGTTVFIYQAPNGIIMVRMSQANPPSQVLHIPLDPLMFPRTREFFRRWWDKVKSFFGRVFRRRERTT